MAAKKTPEQPTPKQNLGDEVAQRVRANILHGEVGYGRPPKEHQFKKGKGSPNPGGRRPRKAALDLTLAEQPFLEIVLKSIDNMITIKENGVVRRTSSREALVESVKVSAIGKLNARSQGLLADWTRQADEAKAREIREDNEFWSAYQQVARDLIAEAKARGEPEPELPRHPDDIITDRDGRLRHIGPFDEISKVAIERTSCCDRPSYCKVGSTSG